MVKMKNYQKQSDKEIDKHVSSHSFKNPDKNNLLKTISHQVWFHEYAKKSKLNLQKITKKVKEGIEAGWYTYENKEKEGNKERKETRREPPKKEKVTIKKGQGRLKKKIKIHKTRGRVKSKTNINKLTPNGKNQAYTHPDASDYELIHGVNSDSSRKYRKRKTGNSNYTGEIREKKK